MAYWYFSDLINWTRMRTWDEVPAKILFSGLERSRATDRRLPSSTTKSQTILYRAFAEFEYEYQGKKYKSDRVSRYPNVKDIGSFHKDIHKELSTYENSEKLFRCFVNPDSPEEAILYRQMRLGMLCLFAGLGGIFGGIALGILPGFLASYVRNKHAATLTQQYPEEPWKWRDDWLHGEARTEVSSEVNPILAITAWVWIFSIPILAFIPPELMEGNFGALLALIFPLVGYWITKSMIGSILQWIRFGRAVFQINSIPVQPGERLRGVIRTGSKFPDSAEVNLELRKVKKRSDDEPVWTKSSTSTPIVGTDGKICIEVDLEIPEQTGQTKRIKSFEWELRAISKIPGIDLDATFKIPVFSMQQS
ncbi:DUF3592 domain-containing protein [bacterium]|nr:DUF3592 domain-containing protein [bacterium]